MSDKELRGLLEQFQRQNIEMHTETHRRVDKVTADLRHEFRITAEDMRHQVQLIAEKVISLDERMTRELADLRNNN
jgi:hypothetical protein